MPEREAAETGGTPTRSSAEPVDLLAALQRSVDAARSARQPQTEIDYTAAELTSWVSRDGRTLSLWSGRDITEPLRISEQNGTTLRHALKGHGLPVSGTKRQQAVRLANAGVSAAHVEAWHTWRGRDSGTCSQVTTPPAGEVAP